MSTDWQAEARKRMAKLCRTWLQVLIEMGHREVAALLVDAEVIETGNNYSTEVLIDLPHSAYLIIQQDKRFQEVIQKSLDHVAKGHITDQNGNALDTIPITYRIRLLEAEEDWRGVVRSLIINSRQPNQALVTGKLFAREKKEPFAYNEMRFGSQSEIRIAQEFERRKVLFFPLPLGVRADTGTMYKDHREPDFLICVDGVVGILEVAYHPDRFEQDAEKDAWYKASGILCVQHYTAERCYNDSAQVVDEFLNILAKHKR